MTTGAPVRPDAPAEPTSAPPAPSPLRTPPAPPAPSTRPAPPAPPASPTGGQDPNTGWFVPLMVLVIGTFMSILDTDIVNIAIPKMQTALSASASNIEWVVTGFTLMLGIVVPASGWLGLRLGLTRLYVLSMLGFAACSALCGLAWSLESMIAFRLLQAIPGGILPVVAMTLLYQIVPPARFGAAMGMYGLGVVVAPAIGPTLGGALVEYFDWRLIFFINVPIGLVGAVLAMIVFPQIKPTTWPRFDFWGFVTIAYGLFAILLALAEGEDWGWTGYRVLGLLVSGVLSLALFFVVENEVDNPLIDLRVFRFLQFDLSLILIGITITGLFSGLYFLPLFLQQVQGMQELDAGLVLLPAALVLVVLMPIAGQIYDLVGPRYPVMLGLAVLAWGSYLLAGITPDTPRGDIELWLAIRNVGVGLAMMPIMTAGTGALTTQLTATGSGMNNIVQRVASSIAVAVFGTLNATAAAQITSDRGGLVGANPYAVEQITGGTAGSGGVVSAQDVGAAYQALNQQVTTQTYANGFYVVAIMSVVGMFFAVFLKSGRQKSTGPRAIEM